MHLENLSNSFYKPTSSTRTRNSLEAEYYLEMFQNIIGIVLQNPQNVTSGICIVYRYREFCEWVFRAFYLKLHIELMIIAEVVHIQNINNFNIRINYIASLNNINFKYLLKRCNTHPQNFYDGMYGMCYYLILDWIMNLCMCVCACVQNILVKICNIVYLNNSFL